MSRRSTDSDRCGPGAPCPEDAEAGNPRVLAPRESLGDDREYGRQVVQPNENSPFEPHVGWVMMKVRQLRQGKAQPEIQEQVRSSPS